MEAAVEVLESLRAFRGRWGCAVVVWVEFKD